LTRTVKLLTGFKADFFDFRFEPWALLVAMSSSWNVLAALGPKPDDGARPFTSKSRINADDENDRRDLERNVRFEPATGS